MTLAWKGRASWIMHQHEQLEVWKRSRALAASLLHQAQGSRGYLAATAWTQIVRAATSVPANIAEGAMRGSDRDFARFLSIALASAAELHTLLLIASDSALIAAAQATPAAQESLELRRMLVALRGRVLRQYRQRRRP